MWKKVLFFLFFSIAQTKMSLSPPFELHIEGSLTEPAFKLTTNLQIVSLPNELSWKFLWHNKLFTPQRLNYVYYVQPQTRWLARLSFSFFISHISIPCFDKITQNDNKTVSVWFGFFYLIIIAFFKVFYCFVNHCSFVAFSLLYRSAKRLTNSRDENKYKVWSNLINKTANKE